MLQFEQIYSGSNANFFTPQKTYAFHANYGEKKEEKKGRRKISKQKNMLNRTEASRVIENVSLMSLCFEVVFCHWQMCPNRRA